MFTSCAGTIYNYVQQSGTALQKVGIVNGVVDNSTSLPLVP